MAPPYNRVLTGVFPYDGGERFEVRRDIRFGVRPSRPTGPRSETMVARPYLECDYDWTTAQAGTTTRTPQYVALLATKPHELTVLPTAVHGLCRLQNPSNRTLGRKTSPFPDTTQPPDRWRGTVGLRVLTNKIPLSPAAEERANRYASGERNLSKR